MMRFILSYFYLGREPKFSSMKIENVKLSLNKSGKINVNEYEQTNVENIFAIGDVQHVPELFQTAKIKIFLMFISF